MESETVIIKMPPRDMYRYELYKRMIEKNGCMLINNAKIYTPEIASILTDKNLSVIINSKVTTINGNDLADSFIEGFNEGCEYFNDNYAPNSKIIYGENAALYVMDIHNRYWHTLENGFEGWVHIKKIVPLTISNKQIKEIGYYSGIVSSVEETVKKYPQVFDKFEVCDHLSNKEKKDNNKEGLTSRYSQNELETIFDKLVNAKWIKGNKSDFVAIFTNVTLPDNWQPIEFIKKNGTKYHASALGTLIKYISPETGYKKIWDGYFTVNNKPLEIPTNNRDSKDTVKRLNRLFR